MKLRYSYIDGGLHPKLGQIFYWRPEALGNGDSSRYNRYICGVLGAIAQTVENCDQLLSCIERIESGDEDEIETGGNGVTLTFKRSGVQVDIDINDDWVGQPEGHFTLHEWRAVLKAWHRFLTLPQSLQSTVEVDL